MKEGRLGYNSYNKRYGLLSSDLWIDTGFHCGECLEVLLDDEWVQTRMEMNPAREWYLVGTPYCGDLEYIRARISGYIISCASFLTSLKSFLIISDLFLSLLPQPANITVVSNNGINAFLNFILCTSLFLLLFIYQNVE